MSIMHVLFIFPIFFIGMLFPQTSFSSTSDAISDHDDQGRLIRKHADDGSIDYQITYEENRISITNLLSHEVLIQEIDDEGKVLSETFPTGLKIETAFNTNLPSIIILPDKSRIEYTYLQDKLKEVIRKDSLGNLLYKHTYQTPHLYESQETLIGTLGILKKKFDPFSQTLWIDSPCPYNHTHLIPISG